MNAIDATLPATRPSAEADWPNFVDAFGRSILEWVRQSGLPAADVELLTQELLRSLHRGFVQRKIDPGAKFRSWLQEAGRTAWGELIRTRATSANWEQASPINALVLDESAHAEFLTALDAACSHQRRLETLSRVQPAADPTDWDVFYRVVLQGSPEAEVAAAANGTRHSVRAAVFRVYRLLEDEFQRIEESF
jgi:DNA-directed RNA polymerase specialized sigma24 family protein